MPHFIEVTGYLINLDTVCKIHWHKTKVHETRFLIVSFGDRLPVVLEEEEGNNLIDSLIIRRKFGKFSDDRVSDSVYIDNR